MYLIKLYCAGFCSVDPPHNMSQLMIDNRYRLLSKIGGGSFGEIFKGFDITTGKEIAIKLEKSTSSHPMLKYEARVYKAINQMKKSCFPKVYYDGVEGDFVVMVMDLCGPSLELLFSYCMRKFSTSTVLMLAVSLLQRVEALHFCNFIHRDLKPENFVMGLTGECSKVFLIDFGLAKRFRDPTTKTHISHATGKPLIGTARYASVNTQLGIEQSRRDDLEGIGMMLVYFLVGRLPWQGIKAVTRAEKDRKVTEKKIVTKPHILCQGLPKCFCDYLTYVRTLKYVVGILF